MEEEKVLAGCKVVEDALREVGVRYENVFADAAVPNDSELLVERLKLT